MSEQQQTHDEPETQDEEQIDDHLEDVDDGCGCTEIWEHLSENRESEDD